MLLSPLFQIWDSCTSQSSEVMRNYLMLYEPENVAMCTVSLGMLCCFASAKNAHISTCYVTKILSYKDIFA